ncbi:MAG: hypothetical protein EZS28_000922 [Streblomastix strix]|uniref:Protein kinase domain-containing protein n=1 Tax=Streblomastix strix TaxID=222440 RepID=A0A5J4X8H2_9EUKA|nr:MAG: hypothetical protein EZS28_000922 [Streblomastix strix]
MIFKQEKTLVVYLVRTEKKEECVAKLVTMYKFDRDGWERTFEEGKSNHYLIKYEQLLETTNDVVILMEYANMKV